MASLNPKSPFVCCGRVEATPAWYTSCDVFRRLLNETACWILTSVSDIVLLASQGSTSAVCSGSKPPVTLAMAAWPSALLCQTPRLPTLHPSEAAWAAALTWTRCLTAMMFFHLVQPPKPFLS